MAMDASTTGNVSDTTLLYGTLTNVQLQAYHDQYGLAYKEFRLGPREQLLYAQALLRSTYSDDLYQAVKILKELTRVRGDEDLLLEYYVNLVIAHFKLKNRDEALFYLDECHRRIQAMSADQFERVQQLKRLVEDHFRFAHWGAAALAASATIGAIAVLIFKLK